MLPTDVTLLNSLEEPVDRFMNELLLERFLKYSK